MSPSLALRLARPSSRADRGRFALIAAATSLAGGLLIAVAHIVRIPAGDGSAAAQHGVANYVTESGLRPGVIIAALLLAVPVLALAVQALRVGSVARDRRMAALRLAGATPREVRAIAAAEACGAAIAGALLASRRLRADPRSAGRVAGVLLVCGIALGFESMLLSAQLLPSAGLHSHLDRFYLTGYAAAGLVVLAGAGVAILTMLVGAADAMLDARRPLATLGALGVDEALLRRALARQLSVTAVPAIVVGVLVGGPVLTLLGGAGLAGGAGVLGVLARMLAPGLLMALVAGLALSGAARLAARLLGPMIRAAIDSENLRVA